ncbi:MAG: DMT family protein [Alphaproteobacteria bacterium]
MTTILLLAGSNILMTFAWYWHLKPKDWVLAFFIMKF